jgi:hypothetical protein
MSFIAKRESISRRLAGIKFPKVRSEVFSLFQVKISPPFRPPPSKIVSPFSTASAGPREFPPLVTELVIDLEEKVSESEFPSKSAALTAGIALSKSAVISRAPRTIEKP